MIDSHIEAIDLAGEQYLRKKDVVQWLRNIALNCANTDYLDGVKIFSMAAEILNEGDNSSTDKVS